MEIIKNHEPIPFAIHIKAEDLVNNKTEWFTQNEMGLQVAGCHYDKGKEFASHKHIFRERVYEYTQEVVVIIKGELLVSIYDRKDELMSMLHLKAGDIGIFLQGGHGYKVIDEDTLYYEIKNGPFVGVKEDKELIQ